MDEVVAIHYQLFESSPIGWRPHNIRTFYTDPKSSAESKLTDLYLKLRDANGEYKVEVVRVYGRTETETAIIGDKIERI